MQSRIQAPVALNSRLLPLRRASATIFRRAAGQLARAKVSAAPSIHQPAEPQGILQRQRLAGMRTGACAASPISNARLRDRVGRVATSSVAVTTMSSAASESRDRIVPASGS